MTGRKRRKYCIYTLDANRMADMYRAQDGCFDLNAAYIRLAIVLADDNMYSDSALFDQVLFALDGIMDREAQSRDITSHLVYLLFENGIRDEAKAKALFDDGFKIRFEGQEEMRSFCSFDKSASMSRENTISFIDEAIFDEVDRRIALDIDFTSIPLTPSKYYAYRGLYMTEGIPVTVPELRLDEETVLVLPDKKLKLKNVSQIKADLSKLEETGKIEIGEESTQPKDGKLGVTPYDGEGFVAPAYADLIRSALFYPKDTKPTSFQIRMPFTKGMLHEVDFKAFLAREFDLSEEEAGELGIEDYFGITRSLKDVEVVLNASMFKCGKWLKNYDPAWDDGDPMKYYFDKVWKYDHCLYVVNTNASIRDTGKINFNYQFLNTLDIDREAFDSLIGKYNDDIQAMRKDAEAARCELLGSDLLVEGDPEDIDRNSLREMSPWEYAVSVNLAFMNDKKTKDELKKLEDSHIANIILGRITVDGLMRYLSGDLLAMLIDMAKGCGFKGTKAIKRLQGETLHASKFYIPNIKQHGIEKGNFYGVLRSPHLSRNEQCALRPYTSRIYNRYFKHLDGVIMVSNLSTAPAALAGADFDGDLVKIVQDETINGAILRGVFEIAPAKESDDPGYKRYRRKLPIAVINAPAGASDIKVGRHISIEHAKASFSSRVGMISNLAITIGELEYSGAKIPAGTTALCTIATGHELDAVKTGVRPDLTYLQKIIEEGQTGLHFIDILKQYRAFVSENPKRAIYGAIEGDEYRASYKTKTKEGGEESIPVFAVRGDAEANIERLPALFVEALVRKRATRNMGFKGLPAMQFLFENDKDWKAKARDDERATDLFAIIKEYRKKRSERFTAAGKMQNQDAQLGTISGCIHTLLSMEYNMESDRLFHTGAEVQELFDKASNELSLCFEKPDEVGDALASMRNLQWQFVPTYEARQEVLAQILDASKLSEEVRELLCDTYDNGYQLLNFFLQYVQVFKKKEEARQELGESGNARKRSYADEEYLEKVLELFGGDVERAIECTAALDDTRTFLWNIFDTEDMAKVIDDGIIRRQINAE